jgi:high-affinity iron transporter
LFLFLANSFPGSNPVTSYLIVFGISTDIGKPINVSGEEAQLIFLNLERINSQIELTAQDLKANNTEGAFYHSYIPHSVIYPTIKQSLIKIAPGASYKLEGLLTDLPIFINSENQTSKAFSSVNIESNLNQIQDTIQNLTSVLLKNRVNGINPSTLLPSLSNNDLLTLQTSLLLLDDSIQSYQKSNVSNIRSSGDSIDPLNLVDYENSIELVDNSEKLLLSIQGFDSNTVSESRLYYEQIKDSINDKQDIQFVAKLIDSLKRNYDSILTTASKDVAAANENERYFKNIINLLHKTTESIGKGNYIQADAYATEAYLDNYEYLEAPIEKINATLKDVLEIDLRENLLGKIDSRQSISDISLLINRTIIPNLLTAQSLLGSKDFAINIQPNIDAVNPSQNNTIFTNSIANIDSLRQGFGVYTGEKKVMGDVADSQKQVVREKVDAIRSGLEKILNLYKDKKYDEAINKAREVYLNNYENIEVPLRPINPDFTLDMEIKFAELRNQLQQRQSFDTVEKKVIEIRNGLDESERLVSGTGVIAPTIAFSSSLSIIFREGLESALIIGAMLTYLEASRNDKFKKHIYLGILFAIAATAVMWIVAENLIQMTGANREFIEGVAGVSAVAVLFWVSFWVLNKIETKKWIEFVKSKVWQATTTGSVMVFVLLSFFTIFREGFETVLFYQSMFSYAKYMESYVIAGLVIGFSIVILVAFVIKRLGKRLPLRVLFGLTMGIGAYMSVAFIGNAVRSFQEADYISTTPMIGIIPRLDINMASMTGIHPTLESFVAQLVLLIIYAVGSTYVLVIIPRRKKKIELSRKSMAGKTGRI